MSVSLAMLALGEGAAFSRSAIRSRWVAHWPHGPAPGEVERNDGAFAFSVGDCHVTCALMPAPIPWSDLEAPCASSRFWSDATSAMRGHTGHMIVTVTGDADPRERMSILTQAACVLVEACSDPIGVYWCSSRAVLPPSLFCKLAVDYLPDRFPLPVWIDVRLKQGSDGKTFGFTRGLSDLGHMEFETRNCPEDPAELQPRLFGLAGYLLQNGPVINDGDTFGDSARERIRVRYGPSLFGRDEQVMHLEYPSTAVSASEPVRVTCPHCDARLRLKDASKLGKRIACPKCGEAFAAEARAEEEDDFTDFGPVQEDTDDGDDDTAFGSEPRPRVKSASTRPVTTPAQPAVRPSKVDEPVKLSAAAHVACGWPLVLVAIGGAIGGGLGGAAYAINAAIYKSRLPLLVKGVLNVAVGVSAIGLWLAIVSAFMPRPPAKPHVEQTRAATPAQSNPPQSNPQGQIKVYTNPLAMLLAGREKQKGAPLTREEVLAIRDSAEFVMMTPEQAEKFYASIDNKVPVARLDPDWIWEEWQEARDQIVIE